MKVGLNVYPIGAGDLAAAARLADQLGYSSLWYGEHIAVPWVYEKGKYPGDRPPFAPKTPFLELFSVLSHLAAHTTRVRLASGIAILPVREPLSTARAIAAVDLLSGGRLDLGVGSGWMEEEFEILVPHRNWADRGSILDEFLDVLGVLWREERPEFHGRHFSFPAVGFEPKPVRNGRVPIVAGGWGEKALRRAARHDGYYGRMDDPKAAQQTVATLRRYREEFGRADRPFEVTMLAWAPMSRGQLDDYEAAGVDQAILCPWEPWTDPSAALAGIEAYAQRMGLT